MRVVYCKDQTAEFNHFNPHQLYVYFRLLGYDIVETLDGFTAYGGGGWYRVMVPQTKEELNAKLDAMEERLSAPKNPQGGQHDAEKCPRSKDAKNEGLDQASE